MVMVVLLSTTKLQSLNWGHHVDPCQSQLKESSTSDTVCLGNSVIAFYKINPSADWWGHMTLLPQIYDILP